MEPLHKIAVAEFPLLLTPSEKGDPLPLEWGRIHKQIAAAITTRGAVLLRGFDVPSIEDFRRFAASFGHSLLSYEFGSTPRTDIGSGVYTSTEYPAHQSIPLHNEQSYSREWPMKIWFHCVTPAALGGETPIADSRAIYRHMPKSIRELLAPGILYVRNYGDFDLPWQKVFNTQVRAEVEAYCRRSEIHCEWKADGCLRTVQKCQSVEVHPLTGDTVWFNQAHLFHKSNLQADVLETLEELLGVDNLPRNTYFADGTPMPDSLLDEVRGLLDAETISFPWQTGDVLMLDNMLVAHARQPYRGPRQVIVAMAEPYGNLCRD